MKWYGRKTLIGYTSMYLGRLLLPQRLLALDRGNSKGKIFGIIGKSIFLQLDNHAIFGKWGEKQWPRNRQSTGTNTAGCRNRLYPSHSQSGPSNRQRKSQRSTIGGTRVPLHSLQTLRTSTKIVKRIDGKIIYVEVDTVKKGILTSKTIYITPSGRVNAISPNHTSKTASSPSYKDIIRQILENPTIRLLFWQPRLP